ncbi:MAG: hypothetical protein K2X35_17340 [Bryobacteraceae bacterium]|nr:hypothetical protein [Bryobacteraceae bacterium]
MMATLERLAAAGIDLAPVSDIARHFVFTRDGFVALVERTPAGGFGPIGSSGLMSERGFAVLVWRGEQPYFVAKGFEQAATTEQVELLRGFSRDLEKALSG